MGQELLFKLDQNPKGRGLRCDAEGLFLGREALLQRDRDGNFEACPADEIQKIFDRVYGARADWDSRVRSVKLIANALNKGDLARATMTAVLTRLPEPGSPVSIADVDGLLAKAGFDPDEPRDERGRWTNDGSESAAPHRDPRIQLADAGRSDASDDPVAEAVARASALSNTQSAVYYATDGEKREADALPASAILPFAMHRDPEQTLTWSQPTHAASHNLDASPEDIRIAMQHQFASKIGGEYWIDPKIYQLDGAIDIAHEIGESIADPTGYMHEKLKEALQSGETVGFNATDWHPGARAIRFQNPIWAGDTVGRVAGKIENGKLTIDGDGTYTAKGTIKLEHTGPYDWTPDGENIPKNAAIEFVGNLPFFIDGRVQPYKEGKPIGLHFTRDVDFVVRGRFLSH